MAQNRFMFSLEASVVFAKFGAIWLANSVVVQSHKFNPEGLIRLYGEPIFGGSSW
jgi:hypothetical protein